MMPWLLLYVHGVPAAVAISEAVSLVKQLSTDEPPAFVNGVLATIAATASDRSAPS